MSYCWRSMPILSILLMECLSVSFGLWGCSNSFLDRVISEISSNHYCSKPGHQCSRPHVSAFNSFRRENPSIQLILPGEANWKAASNTTLNVRVAHTPAAVVYVMSISDVKAVIKLAKDFHLNLKMVSSGHEILGRNNAKGALLMSVARMKAISADLQCVSNQKEGCMTVEPGVTWADANRQADKLGRVIMGGSSLSVSVAGWVFGGGHSPITPKKGLGIDQLLEVEMVLADTSVVVLNAAGTTRTYADGKVEISEDTDLFFAVKGGGGGTFGVVTSLTYKLHIPPPSFSKFVCTFADPAKGAIDGGENMFKTINKAFYPVVERLPNEFGAVLSSSISCVPNPAPADGCTHMPTISLDVPHWGPSCGEDKAYFDELMAIGSRFKKFHLPELWGFRADGQPCSIQEFTTYNSMALSLPIAENQYVFWHYTGMLLQDGQLTKKHQDTEAAILAKAYRKQLYFLSSYVKIGGAKGQPAANGALVESSINPCFRTASLSLTILAGRNTEQLKSEYTSSMNKMVEKPCMYFSEAADDLEPSVWKTAFWGDENYRRLSDIKRKYDMENLFSCIQCVGQ